MWAALCKRSAMGALGVSGLLGPLAASPGIYQSVEAGFSEDFQGVQVAEDGVLHSVLGRFIVEGEGALKIGHPDSWEESALGLRLPGGTRASTVVEVAPSCAFGGTMEFTCQRDGRRRPFAFEISLVGGDGVEVTRDLTGLVNAKSLQPVSIEVPSGVTQLRFQVTAPLTRGVWIDDLRFVPPAPMRLGSAQLKHHTRPLIHGESVEIGVLELVAVGGLDPLTIVEAVVEEHAVWRAVKDAAGDEDAELAAPKLLSAFAVGGEEAKGADLTLIPGINRVPVYVTADLWQTHSDAAAWSATSRYAVSLKIGGEQLRIESEAGNPVQGSWPAVRLMPANAEIDGVSLVTVLAKGDRPEVLVAAISTPTGVVVKRSLNGGEAWTNAPLPGDASSLREASLVFDIGRDKLHILVEQDGAMLHAFSVDQGSTFESFRTLEGLGSTRIGGAASSGVFMSTAELAVPCIYYGGFRIEDEPCAGLIVSRDGGKTWEAHQAAFPNTTTAAVVELGPGALLLNMTDGRGAMRSERTTQDLGGKWVRGRRAALDNIHRSAGSDGALVHLGRARAKGWDRRLVFANANTERLPVRNMTLKGSSDGASNWPMKHRTLLDDGTGVDHPSLCPVGSTEVGVAYTPSAGGVVFQRLPEKVVVPKVASWFDVPGDD